ncbi:putative Coiled-coil domain containing protein [Zalerion maritima]|uniref:Coiled-coil domain containing protein n=1 Tax=Zalerion maritima TaxID=339359 RepID=A0AAD5WRB2_9PEZI|nr:putative Coiled-coil domain containing protein [Zalerion maritima]
MGGQSRQGGKAKPLKAPKKKDQNLDEDDIKLRDEQRKKQVELKAMQELAKGKGPLSTGGQGIKKSGKK